MDKNESMKKLFGKSRKKDSVEDGRDEDDQEWDELAASNEFKGIKLARSPDSGISDRSPSCDQVSRMSAYDRKAGRGSSQGRTPLHKAARKGLIDEVTTELKAAKPIKPITVDDEGSTPLHEVAACNESTAEKVMNLIIEKCDTACVNRRNNHGMTALHIAASGGRDKLVEILLNEGAKVDDCENPQKNTPIHLAAACPDRSQSAYVVSMICENNRGCVNKQNAAGRTPLHLAAGIGNIETVRALLKFGARKSLKDDDGVTAVHVAAASVDDKTASEIIHLLCDIGSARKSVLEIKARKRKTKSATSTPASKQQGKRESTISKQDDEYDTYSSSDDDDEELALIDRRSYNGKTALHVAAGNGRLETVKMLLKCGARRSTLDRKGQTALHHVAFKYRDDPTDKQDIGGKIVIELCRLNPNDNDVDFVMDLHHLQPQQPPTSVEFDGDFVNRRDKDERTALHCAAEYGQLRTIKALLKCGAKVAKEYCDLKGHTPIMAAAFSKETVQLAEILAVLCTAAADEKVVNIRSRNSQWTALHATAFNGQLNAVKTLVEKKADVNVVNKDGNNPLHVAVLARDTTNTVKILETLLASSKDASEKKNLVNETGEKKKTLLHLAAGKCLFHVIAVLVDAGAKLDLVDEDKWTPLHEACATHDDDSRESAKIIAKFCELMVNDPTYLNKQNTHGETAIHMAARFGHLTAVQILLKSGARFDVRDNDGWIALHSSIQGGNQLIARVIVETIKESKSNAQRSIQAIQKRSFKSVGKLIVKKNATEDVSKQLVAVKNIAKLLNEKDNFGRAALHLAADINSADMISELKDLDPEAKDNLAVTPLHVSVLKPNSSGLEAMLRVFYGSDRTKNTNIDHPNQDGDSALHVCCEEGDVRKVKLLLDAGANLECRGKRGSTILHRLVKIFDKEENMQTITVQIYNEIVHRAVAWKCQTDRKVVPKDGSETYNRMLHDVMQHLLCYIPFKGLNVIQYAAKKNATLLLKEMLATPFVFKNLSNETFDVTFLFPDTVPDLEFLVGPGDEDDNSGSNRHRWKKNEHASRKPLSCLELVVNSKDLDRAEEVLGLYPFDELMHGYWATCRLLYNFLLFSHVLFMSLFTVFVMPNSDFIRRRFNLTYVPSGPTDVDPVEADAEAEEYRVQTLPLYGLFLIWPAIIVVMKMIAGIEYIYRTYQDWKKAQLKHKKWKKSRRRADDNDDDEEDHKGCTWKKIKHGVWQMLKIGKLILRGFEYMSHVTAIVFCSAVIAWYVVYIYGTNHHRYCECLATAFIFGWMHTISYVKVFKEWHAFAMTFKHIVASDVTRFAYIFVFVLISFSLAIHALSMSLYPPVHMHTRSLAETIYLTFCLTVTVTDGGLFDISTEEDYENAGGNIQLLHIVFAAYICTSSIILLNMLIAMMNSTYSAISSSKATAWRVESLRTALWIERKIPFIHRPMFVRFPVTKTHEGENPRWFIKSTPEQVITGELFTDEEVDKGAHLRDIRDQLNVMQTDIGRASKQAAEPTEAINKLEKQMNGIQTQQQAAKKQMDQMNDMLKKLVEMQLELNTKLASSDVTVTSQ